MRLTSFVALIRRWHRTTTSTIANLAFLALTVIAAAGCPTQEGDHGRTVRGPAAPKDPETQMPRFPWPPPRYSALAAIPPALLAAATPPTLGAVADRLEQAFDKAGYTERTFYWIPGGFALVSRIEQTRADAAPMSPPARWVAATPKTPSLAEYVKALFNAPPGYYRVIVFVVTDQVFSAAERKPTSAEANEWLSGGALRLPAEVRVRPYTPEHYTAALIYEFERRRSDEQATVRNPSDFPGRTHLEKAGLWRALESP
jgi:hypothetical protein